VTQGKAGFAPDVTRGSGASSAFFQSQQQTESFESGRAVTRKAIMTHKLNVAIRRLSDWSEEDGSENH